MSLQLDVYSDVKGIFERSLSNRLGLSQTFHRSSYDVVLVQHRSWNVFFGGLLPFVFQNVRKSYSQSNSLPSEE